MGKKKQDLDSGSGSEMNNPDHISERFWVKILKNFDADPGWKTFRSGINISDPQHSLQDSDKSRLQCDGFESETVTIW
jgi:hypothetical protein